MEKFLKKLNFLKFLLFLLIFKKVFNFNSIKMNLLNFKKRLYKTINLLL